VTQLEREREGGGGVGISVTLVDYQTYCVQFIEIFLANGQLCASSYG